MFAPGAFHCGLVLFSCPTEKFNMTSRTKPLIWLKKDREGWKPERRKHEEERKGFSRKTTCFLFSQFSWIWSDHHCVVFSAARHMHLPHVIIYFGVRGKAATDRQTDMCFSSPSRNARWNLSSPLVQTLELKSSSLHKRTEGLFHTQRSFPTKLPSETAPIFVHRGVRLFRWLHALF